MKKFAVIGAVLGLYVGILALGSCHAGFLHPDYSGSFQDGNRSFVVDDSGEIRLLIQEPAGCNSYFINSPCSNADHWAQQMSLDNVHELDRLISDLQRVSKEIHDVEKDDKCEKSDR